MSARRWRCFYCGEVIRSERAAREHFGGLRDSLAACQIKGFENRLIEVIRQQEYQIARYRNDDSDALNAMQAMQAEHADALRRAEETGYGRGVRDMKAIAERQIGAEVIL